MKSLIDHIEISASEEDEMVETLKIWAGINSHSSNLAGLKALLMHVEKAFSRLHGVSEQLKLPDRLTIHPSGELERTPVGAALSIKKRPQAPLKIFLAGHLDTVFDEKSSFKRVQTLPDGKLNGPGVADMKGGIIVLLKSLELLERSPWAEYVGWHVLLTPDEEIGSPSSQEILFRSAQKAHVGLVFEPSFSNGEFASARKGSCNYAVIAKGRAAHAGRDFHSGRSAIVALCHYIVAAHGLNLHDSAVTLNIGNISGGEAANIVPASAVCYLNVRSDSEKELQSLEEELIKLTKTVLQPVESHDGMTLELIPLVRRLPKPFDASTKALFEAMRECGRKLDIDLKWKPTGGVCDGNILAQAGLPTIDTLGVIGGNLHTEQEYMEIKSLAERARLTGLFLISIASKELRGVIHE